MTDFDVERGSSSIAAATDSITLTAGVDYTAPSSSSAGFFRIVGQLYSGGNTSGTTRDNNVRISNPENITTSITVTRGVNTYEVYFTWEVIRYTGASGGTNEFVVRNAQLITVPSTETIWTGSLVSGVVDDNDVVVFLTSQETTGSGKLANQLSHTTEWLGGASDLPRVTRGASGATAYASVAVVEFTGSNWAVQRETHSYTAANTTETETLSPSVGSVAKTFIHPQIRNSSNQGEDIAQRVWLSATNQLSYFLSEDASATNAEAVTWVVENTQSGGDTDMSVTRYSGSEGSNSDPVPDTFTETLSPTVTMATTSVWGECSSIVYNNAPIYNAALHVEITAANTITFQRYRVAETHGWRCEVVEWPTESATTAALPVLIHHHES